MWVTEHRLVSNREEGNRRLREGVWTTRLNVESILSFDLKSFDMAAIKVLLQLQCWRRRRTLGLLLSALLTISMTGVHVAGQCPVRQDIT